MDIINQILDIDNLRAVKRFKVKAFDQVSVSHDEVENLVKTGWDIYKNNKKTTQLRKARTSKTMFINAAWKLFYEFSFDKMNKEELIVDEYPTDIVALDDEVAIFAFCKFSETPDNRNKLIDELKKINDRKEKLIRFVKKNFGDNKRKYSFIFITKNYKILDQDAAFMNQKNIIHFDEESIEYYEGLTKHLGQTSRYQLLGYLFSGSKIPEMNNKIPAIEGKMGGHKYYSFSIEPEKLLKIGYVLHRNNANKQMMPTYQRIIKKSRLNSVQEFVKKGGFFPNSVIINIDQKSLNFDYSDKQVTSGISKIGILHLPQLYRSAYIIDGQHRLYGYADSKYSKTNSIPVVAFVNLSKEQQIKLFMEINENQKAVPKNLRTTLNADILITSELLNERKIALKSKLAQSLADDFDSALYQRIIVGENSYTEYCSITLDTIQQSLDGSDFFDQYDKNNELKKIGSIDVGSNDETAAIMLELLKKYFSYFKKELEYEWENTNRATVLLITNSGVFSLIKIMNDIINYINNKGINCKEATVEEILEIMKPYMKILVGFYKNILPEEREKIKKRYGAGGKTLHWRTLQKAINKAYDDFNPDGMSKYWKDNDMRYNERSYRMIRDIELFMRTDFKDKLKEYYGDNWFREGLPKKVYDDLNKLSSDKNFERARGDEVDPWEECLNFIHLRDISMEKSNWQELFSKSYTLPEEKGRAGKKTDKTKWMDKLNKIRNQNFHVYSVTEEEYQFVEKIYNWIVSE